MNIDLTPEQKKAFSKLKAAYKACEKAGIYFANCYGSLQAYDSALVEDYNGENGENSVEADEYRSMYSFNIAGEWADDHHYLRLTPKGMKQIQDNDNE